MMEGLSWFVRSIGQVPGQVTGGLWEQMNEEV